ncbi:MAG: uncharacterized protein A8A55_0450 [Amphiamblys sp. WSBS2006]|nr:MAG: uncharacterized protein A8A55_0450 [Amphiamblys sp. WSBS2006]
MSDTEQKEELKTIPIEPKYEFQAPKFIDFGKTEDPPSDIPQTAYGDEKPDAAEDLPDEHKTEPTQNEKTKEEPAEQTAKEKKHPRQIKSTKKLTCPVEFKLGLKPAARKTEKTELPELKKTKQKKTTTPVPFVFPSDKLQPAAKREASEKKDFKARPMPSHRTSLVKKSEKKTTVPRAPPLASGKRLEDRKKKEKEKTDVSL